MSDLVQDKLRGAWEDDAVSRELVVEFVVSTFLTVLTWLLTRKPKVTPFQADVMFRHLVITGIGSSIGATVSRC